MRLDTLRIRTMIVLVLCCIIIVLVLGLVWLYTNLLYTSGEVHDSDITDSRHLAEILNMYLDDIVSNVNIVATSPDTVESIRDNNSSRMAQILGSFMETAPAPASVYIVNNSGEIVYGTRPLNTTSVSGYDWFNQARNTSGPFITSLYLSRSLNEYAFAVLMPVTDNSSVNSRILAVYSPESLQDNIREHNLDIRDNIMVVDSRGLVISSNDLNVIGRGTNLSSYTPVIRLLQGQSGVVEHTDSWDGQARISAYQPVRYGGWGVIVSTPLSVEYQPLVDRVKLISGLLVVFIIAFSILGYLVSRYITDPITELAQAMEKIASGDYSLRVSTRRKDEIGDLTGTFNKMMDRLEEARFQRDMYIDLMGHDINNLNQIARGYLEIAEHQIDTGKTLCKEDAKLLRKPIQAIVESSNLIGNVRKIQEISTGQLPAKIIDVCRILDEIKEQYSHVPERKVTIAFQPAGKCSVAANELIRDVFANIIGNAIKHSDPEKPLTIAIQIAEVTEDKARYYRIAIEDDGPGIKDEMKASIFQRFARGETKAEGKGLGLFLVKTLVEGYRGKVWVENRVPGDYTQGSRFVIMLPAAGQKSEAE